ncbi:putative hexose transporter [Leptomonas pyrrhocoris]|uniref:Putative hexose transporter n=1 Tax=Leptomonas pyrrhocoris TaxID=157538 RepID=A0A0M9GAI4_LEPPY|nr:putative hexose transporter [Leptomonas pyrrhocoris]XP_015664598.1 putative hexose transporter [Leptomonas pyrrhocoris]KPA86148.1 putative hexose transporter [Leptomonas pyrrhocoris]KPA86159.1 putative hexose transporter [Leptomonas pyrrhocoris]|eukprot:XP_015664587.1 putative hexose transporter [Leptomonas pyrrhocoris]
MADYSAREDVEAREMQQQGEESRPVRAAGIVQPISPEDEEALAMQKLAAEEPINSPPPESEADSLDGVSYVCGFFHWKVARHVVFLVLAGLGQGFPTGINGVFATFQTYSEQCSLYTTEKACAGVINQDCTWRNNACEWTVGMCSQFTREDCHNSGYMHCHYDYGGNVCVNQAGFTSLYSGIFACATMVVGIFLGPLAGDFLGFFHHRKAFMFGGFIFLLSAIMQHAGVATNEYWASTIGRFLAGAAQLFITVPTMVYVNQNAPDRYKQVLTSFFCVTMNLGTALAAIIGGGMVLGVSLGGKGGDLYGLFQGYLALSTAVGVITVLMGYFMEESPYWARESEDETGTQRDGEQATEEHDAKVLEGNEADLLKRVDEMEKKRGINVAEYSWGSMVARLLVGVVVAGVVQLTGITAFMNYAPTITGNVGFDPMVGNIVLNIWNVFSAACSLIILALTTNLRFVFLFGTAAASVACIVMGIVTMPGVVKSDGARNGVSIAAIAVYLLVFQSCIGCSFYPLSQEMFPLSFRPRGSSVMQTFQGVFAFIISVFFPIAKEGLSGGASGNQNKGVAIIYLFFAVIGLIGFVIVFSFLQPWTAEDERRYREKHNKGDAPEPCAHTSAEL